MEKQARAKIAALETHVDMLETELGSLNELLNRCGFPEGITTLRQTVEELMLEEPSLFEE